MDKKPSPPVSPKSQDAEDKLDETSSTAESASRFSTTGTKLKRENPKSQGAEGASDEASSAESASGFSATDTKPKLESPKSQGAKGKSDEASSTAESASGSSATGTKPKQDSPKSQGAKGKSDEASSAESASGSSATGTKPKRESPKSQGAKGKSDVASFTAESASGFSATGTKKKRERSPLRVPSTSRMNMSVHLLVPEDEATGFSCNAAELPLDSRVIAKTLRMKSAPKSAVKKPEIVTSEPSPGKDKSPTCTKPDRKTVDYYESLDIKIAASIKAVESSPPSKTFWEATGAVPKHLNKDSTKTPPKVLPPFQRTPTPTKRTVKIELFKDVSDPFGEPGEQEPSKDSPSCSTETKSPTTSRPISRRDFKDDTEFMRYHCLDFQDYKRTVNNRQKGTENSLNQLLPVMNSAMKDAQRLATKISKIRSEMCDKEQDLRIQNDKLKYLVGRTMAILAKIDDILERFRADILTYTLLTTEGNEGIDSRLTRLVMLIGSIREGDIAFRNFAVLRDSLTKGRN